MSGAQITLMLPGAFRELTEAIRRAFAEEGKGIELAFHPSAPSGMLAQALLEGAHADVIVSANWAFMERLQEVGLVPAPQVLAGNRLCLVVRPDSGSLVTGADSLAQPGLRVVVTQPITDPRGQYVRELFARAGIVAAMQEKARRGELMHARGSADVPAYLADGRAEAGILYVSEAQHLTDRLQVIPLPQPLELSDRIRFTIGAVASGGRPKPEAERFVDFSTGDAGQSVLAAAGFLPRATLVDGGCHG